MWSGRDCDNEKTVLVTVIEVAATLGGGGRGDDLELRSHARERGREISLMSWSELAN